MTTLDFAGFGVAANSGGSDTQTASARVIKAGKPVMTTTSSTTAVR